MAVIPPHTFLSTPLEEKIQRGHILAETLKKIRGLQFLAAPLKKNPNPPKQTYHPKMGADKN